MRFVYKARYLARFDRFPRHNQLLILETDRQIRSYYATRQAPIGLGIRRLYVSGSGKVFEARVSKAIRIIWAEHGDTVSFVLVGSHNDVQHYLRSLR
jgi:hypothetical protein